MSKQTAQTRPKLDSRIMACVDRVATPQGFRERLAFATDRKWNVDLLHVRYLSGNAGLQQRIADVVDAWNRALQDKVRFLFDNAMSAEVRVSFDAGGNWSYIGTDARHKPAEQPTVNLGSITPASDDTTLRQIVLHEFGHVLGCVHEFLNPNAPIPWNEEAVYAFYAGPPNYWDRATTKANVIDKYDTTLTARTDFDPDSIMMYPIPPELTTDGTHYDWKSQLSTRDISFIRKMYA